MSDGPIKHIERVAYEGLSIGEFPYERHNEVNNALAAEYAGIKAMFGKGDDTCCAYCHTPLEYTPYPQNGWGDVMREIGFLGTCDRCGGPVERDAHLIREPGFCPRLPSALIDYGEPRWYNIDPSMVEAYEAYSKSIKKSVAGLVNWRTD